MEPVATRPRVSALDVSDLHAMTVRVAVRLGLVTALVTALVWVLTGESIALVLSAGSLLWSGLGLVMVKMHRENALLMLGTVAVQAVFYALVSDVVAIEVLASLTVILTGVAAFLFLRGGETLFLIIHSTFIVGANILWHGWTDAALAEGGVSALAFIAGSFAVRWMRDRSLDSASRFLNLFDRAPVSLWEEDFSRVGVWLNELRAQGVTDLHGYLDENPDVLRQGMGLIEVVRVNDQAARFLEADDPSDLVGPLRPETFPDDALSSMSAQFEAIWNGIDHVSVEVRRGFTVQGNPMDGLLHWAVPRRFGRPDLSRVIVSVVDVTEMNDARRTLESSLRSKDELIATVSHELRTPLTTVVGLSMELSAAYDQFTKDEAQDLLGMISDQSIEVATIVEDLLVAARAESGLLKVSIEPVDLHREAKTTLRGLEIEEEVDCHTVGVVAPVPADPGRVRQILRNLLVNARRYGTRPIRVIVRDADSSVAIEVRDRGVAIPVDEREAIFDRYYRARQTPGVTASVGLGLTVSRELARIMGGDLTYDYDGESVFTLTLPRSRSTAAVATG
jgi:signal transduction histidine kinase